MLWRWRMAGSLAGFPIQSKESNVNLFRHQSISKCQYKRSISNPAEKCKCLWYIWYLSRVVFGAWHLVWNIHIIKYLSREGGGREGRAENLGQLFFKQWQFLKFSTGDDEIQFLNFLHTNVFKQTYFHTHLKHGKVRVREVSVLEMTQMFFVSRPSHSVLVSQVSKYVQQKPVG